MQRDSRRKTKEVQNTGTRRLLVPLEMEHVGSMRTVNGRRALSQASPGNSNLVGEPASK